MRHIVLGIETSCDETAVALVSSEREILGHLIHSQVQNHSEYGGVVPELAARAHLETLAPLVERCLREAHLPQEAMTAVAATCGPGLIGGVVVGAMMGKAIAATLKIPFIPVNHLEGHALTVRLTSNIEFPYVLLLVSGGHCQFLEVSGVGAYRLLGQTRDDALGEAFDKVASMLNLEYPGGPKIESLAKSGDPTLYKLPIPLYGQKGCDFSFSGLKTAVRTLLHQHPNARKEDIAASFQTSVIKTLLDRTQNDLDMISGEMTHFVLAGGVAANMAIRSALSEKLFQKGLRLVAPPISLCTDNAAMIAWVGIEKLLYGHSGDVMFEPRPRWPLTDLKEESIA